jgi:two-component system NtrC family sensor kinase
VSSDQLAASRKRSARPRWHQLYYLLAAFDLVTVVLSLTLNHQTREVFTHSVAVNQAWRQRLADYSDLGALIAAVNAPGNDVFDSHDAAYESERVRVAQAAYEEHFVVLREEVRANASPAEAARVLAAFDGVAAAMADMTSQAEQIFSLYAQGEPEQAARRMATMDRKYATVLTAQAHLRREVAAIQQETLAQQAATADLLAKFEIVIAGTIILMVTRAVVYGHKLFKRMEEDQRERDRLSEQLADREQRLQELVHRLLVAQEEERRRVAHEVHDGVAQMAAAVQLHFEAFAERVRPRSPAARQELASSWSCRSRRSAKRGG